MKIHNFPGFFLDIEGLDGSGANTQVKLVSNELKKQGLAFSLTKQPTDGPIGKLIHRFLKHSHTYLGPSSWQLLFAADCSFHLEQDIVPKLQKGETVITDRYAWSSIAYGSVYLPKEWLMGLTRDFICPDLTVFIEVAPEICLARLAKETKSFELFQKEEELEHTAETYFWLAQKYWWQNIMVVNGEKDKEKVTADILKLIWRNPKFKKLHFDKIPK